MECRGVPLSGAVRYYDSTMYHHMYIYYDTLHHFDTVVRSFGSVSIIHYTVQPVEYVVAKCSRSLQVSLKFLFSSAIRSTSS